MIRGGQGVHSYLSYLRDRLIFARELLTESGSIFLQIGDENMHRIRSLMDEVFGEENHVALIRFRQGGFQTASYLPETQDFIIWYGRNKEAIKFRRLLLSLNRADAFPGQTLFVQKNDGTVQRINRGDIVSKTPKIFRHRAAYSATGTERSRFSVDFEGRTFTPSGARGWSTNVLGMERINRSGRLFAVGNTLERKMFFEDAPFRHLNTNWNDTVTSGFGDRKIYVVQTSSRIIQRCILMATDPGDLVLDPTCGSGTTAYAAEQWGRRWITVDTSRVALALARARVMGARYPYYLLNDSDERREKEAEVTRTVPSSSPSHGDIRQGFVYERVPHITLRDIANNAEIDVIWEEFQQLMERVRTRLNDQLGTSWEEWEIPRETEDRWSEAVFRTHAEWWQLRIKRQKEIDASIAAKAEFEYLYDKPYEDRSKVRVAGPFTVESVTPHRMLSVDENGEFFDGFEDEGEEFGSGDDFAQRMLEHLKTAGIQQVHKEDKINFDSVVGFPGRLICAEGQYMEGEENNGRRRRAGIYIGPEFGTVSRVDLVEAAREASEIGFDALVACAFNYEAHTTDLERLGNFPVLKARMNADLHMSTDLKNTGKGNLFVIFGEPDVDVRRNEDDQVVVEVKGIDVFHPQSGEVRSDDTDGIACWFVDSDYNGESFFVRQAYFLRCAGSV